MTKTVWEGLFVACVLAVLVLCGVSFGVASDQWSGWVQAIGSVAAIAFAIWLNQRERTLKARAAVDTSWIFIYGYCDALDWSFNAAYTNNREGLSVWRSQIVEYLRVGRSIDLSALDNDMRGLVIRICGSGAQYEAMYAQLSFADEIPEYEMEAFAMGLCSLYTASHVMLMRPDLRRAHERLDLHTRRGVAELEGDPVLRLSIERTYAAALQGHGKLIAEMERAAGAR